MADGASAQRLPASSGSRRDDSDHERHTRYALSPCHPGAASAVPLFLLLAAFFTLGSLYSTTIPLFEAPDEQLHFLFIRHLAAGRGLPVQAPSIADSYAGQEASQPPLYYLLAAPLIAGRDLSALRDDIQDAFARPGQPISTRPAARYVRGPAALFSHDPDLEGWPYGDAALAVHLVRLLSLILGTVTVAAVYVTARILWPERRAVALVAAGLVAFNPQFIFISSVVNNDNLLNAAAALALWLTVMIARRGGSVGAWWALGIVVAIGLLAKFSGLALLALVGAAMTGATLRERSAWPALRALPALVTPSVLLAGWWFARNVALYGEPFGWPTHLGSTGAAAGALLAPERWLIDAWFLFASAWLTFGWMNVWAPLWFYLLVAALSAASVVGWAAIVALPRLRATLRGRQTVLLVLAGWSILLCMLLLIWTGLNPAGRQGRLLFPALGAVATLGAYGLVGWLPERSARQVALGLLCGLATLAAWAYAAVLWPAYAPNG